MSHRDGYVGIAEEGRGRREKEVQVYTTANIIAPDLCPLPPLVVWAEERRSS